MREEDMASRELAQASGAHRADDGALFTPGPWGHHADIACKCGIVCAADHPVAKVFSGDWGDDYPSIRISGGSLKRVAEPYMEQITYGHIDQPVADANARLISAAPDLLDALTELVLYHDVPDSAQDPIVKPLLRASFAAINKALGREAASPAERQGPVPGRTTK